MAKCPFCNHILEDVWLKKIGATLMGKASGVSKARSNASSAADERWTQERKRELRLAARKAKRKK